MISLFKRLLVVVLVLVITRSASAQTSTITSFQNGQITFTNTDTSLEYRVEWMSRLLNTNGYSNIYNSVEYITPTDTAANAMTVDVPAFFRIAATNKLSNNIVRASDLQTLINSSTNAKLDLEWSESPNGPWSTNWQTALEKKSTGSVLTIQSPRFFRIDFVNCPSNFPSCTDWSDQTDPASNRVVNFPVGGNFYSPACMKIKAGQSVTFAAVPIATFANHPLRHDCEELATIADQSSGTNAVFTFTSPGYYGYHCAIHGPVGMKGNLWVIP